MNHPLRSVTYPSLKQLLLNRLQAAVALCISNGSVLKKQQQQRISLNLAKNDDRVFYVSGIALQLSGASNIPSLEIATALSSELVTDIGTVVHGAGASPDVINQQDFTVQVVPPGWILLELTEPAIAAWLQCLVQGDKGAEQRGTRGLHEVGIRGGVKGELEAPTKWGLGAMLKGDSFLFPLTLNPSPSLFAVQYAHARCCSLVRLAHTEGLITLKEPSEGDGGRFILPRQLSGGVNPPLPGSPDSRPATSPAVFLDVVAPNPFPWLNSDQIRFCHPDERALIAQLMELVDDLYCPSHSRQKINWEKAALNLSQAFQTFYSSCRIWGEVKIQAIHLAQARLGLVIATQAILRLLLQDLFGVSAPLEL